MKTLFTCNIVYHKCFTDTVTFSSYNSKDNVFEKTQNFKYGEENENKKPSKEKTHLR